MMDTKLIGDETDVHLTDLVRQVGGWPVDLRAVIRLLDAADRVLPGGRSYKGRLTPEQIKAMGFELGDDDDD